MTRRTPPALLVPPHFSMDEYVDAVEFLLHDKDMAVAARQKAIEKSIKTPFTFNPSRKDKQ